MVPENMLLLPTIVSTFVRCVGRGAEQADRIDRARYAAGGDEIAHLERPQEQQ